MKKIFICLIAAFALFGSYEAAAQGKVDNKLQNDKIMFFSMHLDLTPEEAQAFWPLYNQYTKESWAAHGKAMKALQIIRKKSESLQDEEIEKLVDEYLSAFSKESELQSKYYQEFKKVLPIKKAAKVFVVDDDFRVKLLRQFSEDKHKPEMPKNNNTKKESDEPCVEPLVECQ